jgi:hypothetical protein
MNASAQAAEKGLDLQPSDFLPTGKDADLMAAESDVPKATHWGDLTLGDAEIPSYVLNTGDRVFSLKGVVSGLMNIRHRCRVFSRRRSGLRLAGRVTRNLV